MQAGVDGFRRQADHQPCLDGQSRIADLVLARQPWQVQVVEGILVLEGQSSVFGISIEPFAHHGQLDVELQGLALQRGSGLFWLTG